jgi:GlpG protein
MIWLYQFGRLVEERVGTLYFTLLVIFIAAPSNLAFYLVSGPLFGGMSGIVYGLFFFMWAYDRYSLSSPYRLDPSLAKFFTIFYVLCWILSALGFHVANTVHGVGSLCGLIAGFVSSGYLKRLKKPYRFNKLAFYNVLIIFALIAGGVLTDILTR